MGYKVTQMSRVVKSNNETVKELMRVRTTPGGGSAGFHSWLQKGARERHQDASEGGVPCGGAVRTAEKAGGPTQDVIGSQAGHETQRPPSATGLSRTILVEGWVDGLSGGGDSGTKGSDF